MGGFILQDKTPLKNSTLASNAEVEVVVDPFIVKSDFSDDPSDVAFSLLEMELKFNLGHCGTSMTLIPDWVHSTSDD